MPDDSSICDFNAHTRTHGKERISHENRRNAHVERPGEVPDHPDGSVHTVHTINDSEPESDVNDAAQATVAGGQSQASDGQSPSPDATSVQPPNEDSSKDTTDRSTQRHTVDAGNPVPGTALILRSDGETQQPKGRLKVL